MTRWEDEDHGTNNISELRRMFRDRIYGAPMTDTKHADVIKSALLRLPLALDSTVTTALNALDALTREAEEAQDRSSRFAEDSRSKARIIAETQARLDVANITIATLTQELAEAKKDSDTLNSLGHAIGCCYCTDQGCYTVEPEILMERARELSAIERREWDWEEYQATIAAQSERIAMLEEENAELTRKGEELCCAYGGSLIRIGDLERALQPWGSGGIITGTVMAWIAAHDHILAKAIVNSKAAVDRALAPKEQQK